MQGSCNQMVCECWLASQGCLSVCANVCEQMDVQHCFKYHLDVQVKSGGVNFQKSGGKTGLPVTKHGSSKAALTLRQQL